MKILILYLTISFLLSMSCKSDAQYTKVSDEDIIELVKKHAIDFIRIAYRDEHGNEITDSIRSLLNGGHLVRSFYRNKDGVVDQIRLVKMDDINIFQEIRIRELQSDPFSDINYIALDCSNSEPLLERAFRRDQNVRQGLINDIQEIDRLNRDTVISIIDNCDWPTRKEEIKAIWYIIQHGGTGRMAYYYPRFKDMVDAGLLEDSLMAKMEDRMLVFHGYPQLYGTQLLGTGGTNGFRAIKDVINVNKRRKKVGLVPIEQRARSSGFEFKMEDYQQ